jgi:hypothetical protein
MRATTHLTSREAKRRIRFHFDGLPPTVPTLYFLQNASLLGMNRLE